MLPCRVRNLMGEAVGGDRHLRYGYELCLLSWNIRCEVRREVLLVYPPVAIAVRPEGLGRLRQALFNRRTALTFVKSKCSDIDSLPPQPRIVPA